MKTKCLYCGFELNQIDQACVNCGRINHYNQTSKNPVIRQKYIVLWIILGFLFPFVGIVISGLLMDRTPQAYTAFRKGSITSTLVGTTFFVCYFVYAIFKLSTFDSIIS